MWRRCARSRRNSAPCCCIWPPRGCAPWGWRGDRVRPAGLAALAGPGGGPPTGSAGRRRRGAVAGRRGLWCWPAEDAVLLDAAGPRLAGGKVTFDPAAVAAREAFSARRALAWARPVSVLVLGSAHDL